MVKLLIVKTSLSHRPINVRTNIHFLMYIFVLHTLHTSKKKGFEGAKVLAKKMTVLYQLSKEQLSKQFHYDFGLRALKSVLVMAGGLKRQYQEMAEDLVLMRCLRDSNIPKFVYEDVPLFLGLINDLFPGPY